MGAAGIISKGHRQGNYLQKVIVKAAENIRRENGRESIIPRKDYLPEAVNSLGAGRIHYLPAISGLF